MAGPRVNVILSGTSVRIADMPSNRSKAASSIKAVPMAAGVGRAPGPDTPSERSSRRDPLSPAARADPGASPWRASRERLRDREVKRDAVIRAAARAFNRKGYHNTSLDDIAAALEVTKPTVYYYVSNKEQLLFECFVAGIEGIRAAFREARSLALPARERLKAVLRHYGEAVASEFGWCMVRAEDQDLSPDMSAHIKAMKSEIDQGIRRLLREGIQDGSIHPCDPKMTAFALAGALNWIAHWYRESQAMTGTEIAEAFIAVFESGLRPRPEISNQEPTCRPIRRQPKSSSSGPSVPRSARSRAPSRR
jgi:AcrR family transcriptional regulator